MAKDYGDGVWRTINGRRVFIAEGQSLGDAMKKSGKFGNVKKVQGSRQKGVKEIDYLTQKGNVAKMNSYDYPKDEEKYHKYLKDKYDTDKEEKIKDKYGRTDYKKLRNDFYKEENNELAKKGLDKGSPLNKKLYPEDISTIATTTNSINDTYGYAFNKMLDSANREGLKVKDVKIGLAGENNAKVEFENGAKLNFYDLKGGKAIINDANREDFNKIEKALNSYRVASRSEDVKYDFDKNEWINQNENTKVQGMNNDKYDKKYSSKESSKESSKDKVKLNERQIEEGNRLSAKAEQNVRDDVKAFTSGRENYEGSQNDFINDLANEHNVDRDKVEEIVHEELTKHPRGFKKEISKSDEYREIQRTLDKSNGDKFTPRAKGSKSFEEHGVAFKDYDTNERFSDYLRDKYGTDDIDIITTGSEKNAKSLRDEFNKKELKEYQNKMLNNDDYLQANRPNEYFNKMIREKAGKTKADRNIDAMDDKETRERIANASYKELKEIVANNQKQKYNDYVSKVAEESGKNKESGVIQRAVSRMTPEQKAKTFEARLRQRGQDLDEERAYYTQDRMNKIIDKQNMSDKAKASAKQNLNTWKPAKNDQELRNRYSEDIAYDKGATPNASKNETRNLNNYKRVELNRINNMLSGERVYDTRNGKDVGDARNLKEDKESTSKIMNNAIRNRKVTKAYENYIKKHPNSKITLSEFKDLYQG